MITKSGETAKIKSTMSKTKRNEAKKTSESNSILNPISPLQENNSYKIRFLIKPGAKKSRVTNIDKEWVGLQVFKSIK